jgi:hypothetical protein
MEPFSPFLLMLSALKFLAGIASACLRHGRALGAELFSCSLRRAEPHAISNLKFEMLYHR